MTMVASDSSSPSVGFVWCSSTTFDSIFFFFRGESIQRKRSVCMYVCVKGE